MLKTCFTTSFLLYSGRNWGKPKTVEAWHRGCGTYRAGNGEKYATCPAACKMNCSGKGSQKIDPDYLDALLDAVPRKGVSFTYSHFDPRQYGWDRKLAEGKTVINFSTENKAAAAASIINGVPSVTVVSPDSWEGKKKPSPLAGMFGSLDVPPNIATGLAAAIVATAYHYAPDLIGIM